MLEAVVFDFGGTLFHADDAVALAVDARYEAMRERGYDLDRETFDALSERTNECFAERYAGDHRRFELGRYSELFFDVWGREAPDAELEALDRVFWETRLEHESLDDHARTVIGRCRDLDLFVGAITNGNALMTTRRLASADLDDAFDLVLTSASIGAEKSTVEPFEVFLERTGFDGEACLMVGDRRDEDTWATEVGMTTVLLTDARSWTVGEEREPDYPVDGLDEVVPIVERLA